MDRVVWLVAGNKGGAGKSAVAKSLIEWLQRQQVQITIIDGDARTPDVASVFSHVFTTFMLDLHEESGWPEFSDIVCRTNFAGHVVANLPDGVSDRAMQFFSRFSRLVKGYDFKVRVLFVMNPLPDGLHFLGSLMNIFPDVIPVKNLFFGSAGSFGYFDDAYGSELEQKTVFFPAMNAGIMQVVRGVELSFSQFLQQQGDCDGNFIYAKLVVAQWFDNMIMSFDGSLPNLGDVHV